MKQPGTALKRAALGLILAGAACGFGCESGPLGPGAKKSEAPVSAVSGSPAAPMQGAAPTAVSHFGSAFEPGTAVALPSLLSDPRAYADKTVTTEGKVQRACSRKGCWMEIGEGPDACRVTFKNYGFFVPTDSAGAYARIQGRLDTREVEAAAVQHLESEGARFRAKRADGSATEVRLIASAVELRR